MAVPNATIGEVTSLVTKGTTPTTLGRNFTSRGIGFIKAECISSDGGLIKEKQVYIDEETDHLLKRSRLQEDDVLFSIAGVIGRTALVQQSALPANTNQAIAILRPDTSRIIPRFLYYTVRARGFQDHSLGHVVQTAQANVSLGVLSAAPIWLPSLSTQRRIASTLSAYDDLIENSQRRIKILESMARALYREWFVHFRFPGHENHPRVASALGEIPEGWEALEFRYLFDIRYGKTLPKTEISDSGHYPVYGAGDVIGFYDKMLCPTKCTLVTSRGNGSGTVWRTREAAFVTNNSLIMLPREDRSYWDYSFVELLLKHANVMEAKTGSAQPQVTIENLNYVKAIVPTKPLVVKFCKIVTPIYEQVDSLFQQIQNLRRTRDLLLPRLLSGQIDVEAMPS